MYLNSLIGLKANGRLPGGLMTNCPITVRSQLLTMMKKAKPPAMMTKPDPTDDPVRGSRGLLVGLPGFHTLLDARLPPLACSLWCCLRPIQAPAKANVPPTVGLLFFMKRPFCSRDDAARHDDHLFQTGDGLLDDVVVCAVDYLTARKGRTVSGLSAVHTSAIRS